MQNSKLVKSHKKWKEKANMRGSENNELRKRVKRQKKRIDELKAQVKALTLDFADNKKNS